MFIKYEGKIYKQVELEELSKEELLEVVKGARLVPKEITIRDIPNQIISPRLYPPNISDTIRYKDCSTCGTLTTNNTEEFAMEINCRKEHCRDSRNPIKGF